MRCLVIDHEDSFTWNLVEYITQISGSAPIVVRHHQHTWAEIEALYVFDAIVLSPGPGTVTNPQDWQVSRSALTQQTYPVLGVCLGMQGLAYHYGAQIQPAPEPYHGRNSVVVHDHTSPLFVGIPKAFSVTRYHSLVVAETSLPACLTITARTECGLIMALQHRVLPQWGVQFHPESIQTAYGYQIMTNFLQRCVPSSPLRALPPPVLPPPIQQSYRCWYQTMPLTVAAADVFAALFAAAPYGFWLDSQTDATTGARFSFMGAVAAEAVLSFARQGTATDPEQGELHLCELEQALSQVQVVNADALPFDFCGGYVGFMAYEMRAVLSDTQCRHRPALPDSAWLKVERFLAFDQLEQTIWLVAVANHTAADAAQTWLHTMEQQLQALSQQPAPIAADPEPPGSNVSFTLQLDQSMAEYSASIDQCQQHIRAGESYEICLTNRFVGQFHGDPLALYRCMRQDNPAPFGAFIRVGDHRILSTSPERFVQVNRQGWVQAKPIKGTSPRSDDAAQDAVLRANLDASVKDQAENLMIVDLMRHDLTQVSVTGSVKVPKLMDIESYQTVHQMVSTVESQLRPEVTLIDLLRAIYPGGSITGAPKRRTMQILDTLEPSARGIYCGSLGFLGYNQVADLNIAIRTLSLDEQQLQFGAGGAITFLSDPAAEQQEVLLKAEALLKPMWRYLTQSDTPYQLHLIDRTLHLMPTSTELAKSRRV
jgi:para-aminobenzoate synthetase